MAKRVTLPSGALDDVCTLLRLSPEQLTALDGLFETSESASPLRTAFVHKVAESLRVDIETARSLVMVCHFILRHSEAKDSKDFVSDILDDIREFLENSLPEDDSEEVLASFDENRDTLKSLATPKPAPLRVQKIRRLGSGPEQHIESIKTICQLRPLFEGPEDEEKIVGLVPHILLEIETLDSDDNSHTLAFGMSDEILSELEKVVKRTKEKRDAVREKYHEDLLTLD